MSYQRIQYFPNRFLAKGKYSGKLRMFEKRIGNNLYIKDYKGREFKYARSIPNKSLSTENEKQLFTHKDFPLDLFSLGLKRKKAFERIHKITVKFSPRDSCINDCMHGNLKNYLLCKESFTTCDKFACNSKGSTPMQKQNKQILTRFKIKQEDLKYNMEITIERVKPYYSVVGYSFTKYRGK